MNISDIEDPALKSLAEHRREQYHEKIGKPPENGINDTVNSGFTWSQTPEGQGFWNHVNNTGKVPEGWSVQTNF